MVLEVNILFLDVAFILMFGAEVNYRFYKVDVYDIMIFTINKFSTKFKMLIHTAMVQ